MDLEREKSRARKLIVCGWVITVFFIFVFLVSALKSIAISLKGYNYGLLVNIREAILSLYYGTQYPVVSSIWEYAPVFDNYNPSSIFTLEWLIVFLGFFFGNGLVYVGKKVLREHAEAASDARKIKLTEAYKKKLE
ncbi:hypothetical protein ACSEOI_09640 [Pseudomonas aeruginosa]|nr:hypothetical protein [Pseudomonas aeruginosa]HBP5777667.1 hypothetical protein [Pseudomonas aeruginosa]